MNNNITTNMPEELDSQAQPSPVQLKSPRSRRPSQTTGNIMADDDTGPTRLPRPMTVAELHHELEKEQEHVVNRLNRELSELRARANSTTSTASSTSSSSALDQPLFDGPSISTPSIPYPTSSRSQRSSFSVSTRGTTGGSISTPGTSQASVDRARDAGGFRSRQNSLVPTNIPSVSAPAPPRDLVSPRSRPSSVAPSPAGQYFPPAGSPNATGQGPRSPSRQEEAAAARSALEVVRKENEVLAARVRELEAQLKAQSIA